ncbi:hypothetical protein EMIT0196P_30473 [Pseudomonas chlororaphis]
MPALKRVAALCARLVEAGAGAQDPAPPGERVDAFAVGEDVAEMRLVAEAAFQADLRQGQVGVLDQLLGPGDALAADPFLGRQAGAALEGAGEMAAGQGAGPGEFGDFQGAAQAVEDHLLDQAFAPGRKATGGGFSGLRDGRPDGVVLSVGHDEIPCRWACAGAPRGGPGASRFRKQVCAEGFILGGVAGACELNVVNSVNPQVGSGRN